MQVSCYHILGNTFHFGRRGLGTETTAIQMSSDSLFSALISRLACRDGAAAVKKWIEPFLNGQPPLVITATYPLAGQVRFFPPPANVLRHEVKGVRPKDLKRVKFVSEKIFRNLLDGQLLGSLYPHAVLLQGGQVLLEQDELPALPVGFDVDDGVLWSIERRSRVTLERANQKSDLFFTGQVSFAAGSGLWFGVRWLSPDPLLETQLNQLLSDLADAGLGADRTAGYGACQIQREGEFQLPDPDGKPWVSLSSYLPSKEEMLALQHPEAAYQIQPVGGWMESPVSAAFRRRTVNLIVDGSVLGPLPGFAIGRIADVHPSEADNPNPVGHAVYRSGLAFAVGMQGGRQ